MTRPRKKQTKNGKNSRRRRAKPVKRTQATPGEWFEKLVAVQAKLRAPDGCPWDREQTHESLRTYLIEEAYEVLEAMESRNDAKFAEEMGDLLLQIVFHSQMAQERGGFTISDVIREIHDKMIRRHPHVFGETRAKDSADVLRNWEQIKAEERRSKAKNPVNHSGSKPAREASLLDGVSRALPATLEGFQLTRKASRIGFDWETAGGIFEKMGEETRELQNALEDFAPWKSWRGKAGGSSRIYRDRKWKRSGISPSGRSRKSNGVGREPSDEFGYRCPRMRKP